jgi:hypothetical protein
MDEIREIWTKHQEMTLQINELSEQTILQSTRKKSNGIISVFKRDIQNVIIYFVLLIPSVTLILFFQSINFQSIILGLIILLSSIYITIIEFQFLKKMQPIDKTEDLKFNIITTIETIKEWSNKSKYHILLPAIIIQNALLLLANALSQSEMPFNSFNFMYSIIFSVLFGFILYYWFKSKELQYTAHLNSFEDEKTEKYFNKQWRKTTFTTIVISFIALVLLILVFLILFQLYL